MKNKKLTEEENEFANLYALEKWPDETVTVEEQTDSGGGIVFRRVKITTKSADKVLPNPKKKRRSGETAAKGDARKEKPI